MTPEQRPVHLDCSRPETRMLIKPPFGIRPECDASAACVDQGPARLRLTFQPLSMRAASARLAKVSGAAQRGRDAE